MNVPQYPPPLTLFRLICNLATGREPSGIRLTDATFRYGATRDLTPHQRAPRRSWLPGYRRAMMRAVFAACAVSAVWGAVLNRPGLIAALITVILGEIVIEGIRIYRRSVAWNHHRTVIYPLWFNLAGIVGYPVAHRGDYRSKPAFGAGNPGFTPREDIRKFLVIPRDYRTNDDAVVRFEIPFTWEADAPAQKRVTQLISRHLGGDWVGTWSLDTSPRFLAMCRMPRPPRAVTLAEIIPHVDASPDSVLTLAIGTGNKPAGINLDSDAPHVSLSMGSGGGKSDTVALIIATLVRKRAERIDVIDPKIVTHSWARGLPGVHIYRYVPGQMEAIHNARLRMDSRYDALLTDDSQVFGRQVIVVEEMNSLMTDLTDYWTQYRAGLDSAERARVPRTNPAIADLRYILNKGRQCRIHIVAVYQRQSAAASGGGDARENFGAKILARASHQTWKMLVGTRMPPMSRIPGRAYLVIGDDIAEIQRAHASITKPDGSADREGIARLRAFALDGRQESPQAEPATVKNITIAEPELELVTLPEACREGIVTIKYGAARKARSRDPEFPRGIKTASGAVGYLPAELRAWEANRLRAPAQV
jgi:hypothetical protein